MTTVVCESCGMPMVTREDYGGRDPKNRYCVHCTDKSGKLKPKEEVRRRIVDFYIHEGYPKKKAEKMADEHLARMPAWRDK